MAYMQGTVVVVTGASRGVGRGIALELGAAGATVYVTGRSHDGNTTEHLPGTIEETAIGVTEQGGQGIAVVCDHTIDGDVESLFAQVQHECGHLDVLVNSVWGGYEQYDYQTFDGPFWEQPLRHWEGMFVAGVRAHYIASRYAVRLMLPQQQGLIISISSGDGQKYRGNVLYDTSKTAIDRMMFGMARQLQPYGIAALSLYPGFVRTERVMAVHAKYPFDLSGTESPAYTGRAVVSLISDPNRMLKSGNVFKVGDLAREYGFTDADGCQPAPWVIP